MDPDDFTKARQSNAIRVEIDGWPYCPQLCIEPNNETSVRQVVAELLLPTESSDMDAAARSLSNLHVSRVSGGITNVLYKVTGISALCHHQQPANITFDSCLVRVFGAEGMIDRDVETATFAALGRAGIAPAYYGRFGNGRVEEWKDARVLTLPEMAQPEISARIATQLARLHRQFQLPTALQRHHPLDRPSMWTQLDSWLAQAVAATFASHDDTQRARALHLDTVRDEVHWLKSSVCPADAPVAFCHNDALAYNILIDSDDEKHASLSSSPRGDNINDQNGASGGGNGLTIQLIDFEYGGINYAAFDIANHWNEWAGGTVDACPDYDLLPSASQQELFCRAYLMSDDTPAAPTPPDDNVVAALVQQVRAFMLPNHLYWALWAVNQAAHEGCRDFDYLEYARRRLAQYYQVARAPWRRPRKKES